MDAAAAPPPSARYEPKERLGAGSMGVVYRVFDRESGRDVALKTLRGTDAEDLWQLKQEFRVLASVSHPHLVQLYDLEVGGEHAFFTMEWIRGSDFVGHVRRAGVEALRDAFEQPPGWRSARA